jgi:hypothetical protein
MRQPYTFNLKRLETAILRKQAGVPPNMVCVPVEDLRLLLEHVKRLEQKLKRDGERRD